MNSFKIFIVEDDPWYGRLLEHHLSMNPDYHVVLFTDGKSCLKELHQKPNVICIDYGLPDMDGEQLLDKIQSIDSSISVIIISGQEEISIAVDLLKKGAKDYIVKDENTTDHLWKTIINVRENSFLRQEVETLKEQLEQKFSFKSIIGNCKAMQGVFSLLEKAIRSNINVSISGETGTGKEVVAKAIHFNGPRKKKSFIPVNMAAIPKDLLESELFGHEKGAFTGAVARKIGKFEQADKGTLFLDEIAEMDINLQSKILRVLQEREFTRVGGTEIIKFDARIITATHKDLVEEVKAGNFREDLYYRLIGLPIKLPPLREREGDVILLANFFIEQYVKENKLPNLKLLSSAKDKLLKYRFSGNVRELKAVLDLACVMCDGKSIKDSDIIFSNLKKESVYTLEEKTLKEYNNEIISYFLKKYKNNVVLVANKLGIGKSKIYNLIKSGEINQE